MPDEPELLLTDFSFGKPPASISPSCGAPIPGTGGAELVDSGILGALNEFPFEPEPTAPPPPNTGALLSFVWAFFSLAPFLISPSSASRPCITDAAGFGALVALAPVGGGGGGGGGGPAIFNYSRFVAICLQYGQ